MGPSACAWLFAAVAVAAVGTPAVAADELMVEVATFEAGRFVIAGVAPPGVEVRVTGTDITDAADPATGAFRIARRTVLPGCTIEVDAGSVTASVAVANCREAMVGLETPQPTTLLRPRGGWNSTRSYRANDVVDFDGGNWLALSTNKGRQPGLASTVAVWSELDPGAEAVSSEDPEEGALDTATEAPPN